MRAPEGIKITRDQAEKAAAAIGLPSLDGVDEGVVAKAFRFVVRSAHPDTDPDTAKSKEWAELMTDALINRYTLLQWLSEQPDPMCAQCGGSGWVNAGGGRVRACSNPKCGEV